MDQSRHRRATAAAQGLARVAAPLAFLIVAAILVLSTWRGTWDLARVLPTPTLTGGNLLDEFVLGAPSLLGAGIGLTLLTAVAAVLLVLDHRPWGAVVVMLSVASGRVASLLLKSVFEAPRPNAGLADPIRGPEIATPILIVSGIVLGAAFVTRWRRPAVVGASAFALVLALNELGGMLVSVRPGLDSFPSGHAVGSAALVLSTALVVWRSPRRRVQVIAFGLPFVALVGLSRIYLREHYPADVAAGWALAVLCVVATAGIVYAARAMLERAAAPRSHAAQA